MSFSLFMRMYFMGPAYHRLANTRIMHTKRNVKKPILCLIAYNYTDLPTFYITCTHGKLRQAPLQLYPLTFLRAPFDSINQTMKAHRILHGRIIPLFTFRILHPRRSENISWPKSILHLNRLTVQKHLRITNVHERSSHTVAFKSNSPF